jgi:hypothetical protein
MKEGVNMFNRTAFKIRLAVLLVAILAGCGDVVQVTTVSLVSLSVTPADPSIAINTDQPFTAPPASSRTTRRET